MVTSYTCLPPPVAYDWSTPPKPLPQAWDVLPAVLASGWLAPMPLVGMVTEVVACPVVVVCVPVSPEVLARPLVGMVTEVLARPLGRVREFADVLVSPCPSPCPI